MHDHNAGPEDANNGCRLIRKRNEHDPRQLEDILISIFAAVGAYQPIILGTGIAVGSFCWRFWRATLYLLGARLECSMAAS